MTRRPKVFVCYRHGDASTLAHLLRNLLAERWGPENVFIDDVSIQPGDEFPALLRAADKRGGRNADRYRPRLGWGRSPRRPASAG